MVYVVPLEPSEDYVFNMTLLYYMSKIKKFYVGTYYFGGGRILPVFNVNKPPHPKLFKVINGNELKNAYKMVCIRCGACCRSHSGAFIFHDEALEAGILDIVRDLPSKEVKLVNGTIVRIYGLDVGDKGRCIFYSGGSCMIEEYKPIICRITYCGLVAERNGVIHVKIGCGGRAKYVPWNRDVDELRMLVMREVENMMRI